MIGSITLFVKSGSKYSAHIVGGMMFDYQLTDAAKKKHQSTFTFLNKEIKKWGKPDAYNLTEGDVAEIVASTNCCEANTGKPGYNKFAGDWYVLVDLGKKLVRKCSPRGEWKPFKGEW